VACHTQGGPANPITNIRLTHGPEWLIAHVRDPQVIAPGTRPVPDGAFSESAGRSVVSYMAKVRTGASYPSISEETRTASLVIGRYCASCHMIDGEGGSAGPDLTHAGAARDAKWLKEWIADPSLIDPAANMPPFGDRLTDEELTKLADYLASRK
jgi:mono/diheme cytochrome c family protein